MDTTSNRTWRGRRPLAASHSAASLRSLLTLRATTASAGGPKIVERLGDLGFVTKPMSPAEFTAFVANQVQNFQAPVKASGAKL